MKPIEKLTGCPNPWRAPPTAWTLHVSETAPIPPTPHIPISKGLTPGAPGALSLIGQLPSQSITAQESSRSSGTSSAHSNTTGCPPWGCKCNRPIITIRPIGWVRGLAQGSRESPSTGRSRPLVLPGEKQLGGSLLAAPLPGFTQVLAFD